MPLGLGALLIGSAIMAAIGGTASIASSAINAKSVEDTNKQNIEAQKAINAQSQFNMEHAHQIEMADLKAAGLNPVLTATGGNGAPLASLNAPRAQAPQVDLSGISSAMTSMTNMMLTTYLLEQRMSMNQDNINSRERIASGRNESYDNRTNLWSGKNLSKAVKNMSSNSMNVNSAKQVSKYNKKLDDKLFRKLIAEIEDYKK